MPVLSTQFLNSYRSRAVNWGFPSGPNYLGELVYRRTYRRGSEEWRDTVERVVNGTFELVERHCVESGCGYDALVARARAELMYEHIFSFKFTPPGRGLWMMGTDFFRRNTGAALNNCGFTSTENVATELSEPFEFLMDGSMLGVGVGFDTEGAGRGFWGPASWSADRWTITDDREGWVESTGRILRWGFGLGGRPSFDYSEIRPYGSPIKGFGGVASGPGPLIELHERLYELIGRRRGQYLSSRDIVDIMNMIGACVVAGNVRRTAEIAFGQPDDEEYLDLKNYEKHPERGAYGWTSNNTVFAKLGMNYGPCASRTRVNGEPGYSWLENMRAYGRMADPANWKDLRVKGGNPCLEQSLEDKELCCLVEQYPHHHDSLAEFKKTAESAWLYAKAVTLVMTHWPKTNEVIRRNRRVGASVSGVAQFLEDRGEAELVRWLDKTYRHIEGFDRGVSALWGVNESVKKTSVKPSGTVSLLAGATPGCHYPTMTCYIRRVRYAADHPDVAPLQVAGYPTEPAIVGYEDYPANTRPVYDPKTVVVEFPVRTDPIPTERDIPLRRKIEIAVLLQRWWADNQVSCTAAFLPEEGSDIEGLLSEFDHSLKGVSFLPIRDEAVYPQMPYEAISSVEYEKRIASLQPVTWAVADTHSETERFCDGGVCQLVAA